MWRDEARVRARMADIERATAETRRLRGDALPPLRPRAVRVRQMMARLGQLAATLAIARAGAIAASSELAEQPTRGNAGCGHRA